MHLFSWISDFVLSIFHFVHNVLLLSIILCIIMMNCIFVVVFVDIAFFPFFFLVLLLLLCIVVVVVCCCLNFFVVGGGGGRGQLYKIIYCAGHFTLLEVMKTNGCYLARAQFWNRCPPHPLVCVYVCVCVHACFFFFSFFSSSFFLFVVVAAVQNNLLCRSFYQN